MKENENKSVGKLSDEELVFQLEGKPSLKVAFPLGLQHVLSMFVGNITPILIVIGVLNGLDPKLGFGISAVDSVTLIQAAMLASGLTTMLQLYPFKIGNIQIGGNLPIVMGTSFAFVPVAITIGKTFGLAAILGSCLVGSFVAVAMGFLYRPLKLLFNELVVGAVLIAMGVKLLGPGVAYFAGGFGAKDYGSLTNMGLGFLVFAIVIALQKWGKGLAKMSGILIAIVIGYIVAIFLGKVDFTLIQNAAWIGIPIPPISPLDFEFHPTAIASFALIFIIVGIETIGNTNGITIAAFDRKATEQETSGAVLADGIGCFVASLLNAMPNTAFGQNAGIVAMTKIVNKWCIAVGGIILILAAFIPKFSALFRTIPNAVLGGAILTVFAIIIINGIKMIAQAGFSERNVIILGITFGIGYGFGVHPEATKHLPDFIRWIFEDTIACVCIIAMLATLIFAKKGNEEKTV